MTREFLRGGNGGQDISHIVLRADDGSKEWKIKNVIAQKFLKMGASENDAWKNAHHIALHEIQCRQERILRTEPHFEKETAYYMAILEVAKEHEVQL
jgi:hypothetical protein